MPRIREIDLLPSVPAGGYVLVTEPVASNPGWSVFAKVPASALGGGGPGGGFTPGGTTSQLLDGTGLNVTVGSGLTLNPSTHTLTASASSGVASFNTRTGAVTLSSGDVTTALTYTPYNVTNPANYVTAAGASAAAPVQSVAGRGGAVTLTHNDITDWATTLSPYALTSSVPTAATTNPVMNGAVAIGSLSTYAKADHIHPVDTSRYAATNPSGYQTAAQVTAVLPVAATVSTLGTVKPDGTTITIDGTGKITSTASGGFTPGGTVGQLLSGTGSNVVVGSGLTLTGGTLTGAGGGPALPGGTAGQIQWNSAGTALSGFTMSGDATLNTSTGAITVTKANGQTISTTYAPIASPTFTGTVTAPNLTIPNAGSLNLLDASGTAPHLTVQADNNMVLFGTGAAGAARPLLAAQMRSASAPLTFYTNITTNSGPLTLTNGRFLSLASGGAGSIAVSDGTSYSGMFVNGTGMAWGPTNAGADPSAIWASLASGSMTVNGAVISQATQASFVVTDAVSYNGMFINGTGIAWGPTTSAGVPSAIWASLTSATLTAPAISLSGGSSTQLLDAAGIGVTVGTGLTLNNTTHTLTASGGGPATAGGTNGQIQFNNSTVLGGFTMSGDATLNTSTGVITVTKTNGTAFGAAATAAYGSANPAMDSGATGGPGVATTVSRSDHFHPSDTSRAPTASPTFTGTVNAASLALTTPLPLASGGVGSATASGARTNLVLDKVAFDIDFSQGAVVANGPIIVVRKAPFGLTIDSMDYEVGSAGGSFTVAVQINATPVTGLSAVAVSSATTANATASAAKTVAAGDKISVVISALSGSPTGANLQINGTR